MEERWRLVERSRGAKRSLNWKCEFNFTSRPGRLVHKAQVSMTFRWNSIDIVWQALVGRKGSLWFFHRLGPYLPITSAFGVCVLNQASSPNFPSLYLDSRKSLGNPQTTDTKRGRGFTWGSTRVANPLRSARDRNLVVQQRDCITHGTRFGSFFYTTKSAEIFR